MLRPVSHTCVLITAEYIRWFCSFFIALCIIVMGSELSGAQSSSMPGNITIAEGGKVWIDGSAGPVNFQCNAERLSGAGEIQSTSNPQATVQGENQVTISVKLPVKALNCGKRAMNKDMYEALKAQQFPTISYQVLEASLVSPNNDSLSMGWMNIRTRGVMEIAGITDTTTVIAKGKVNGENKFHVKGSKDIHMDTYNIDPPSKMFGLIRASKDLTVHFDVNSNATGYHSALMACCQSESPSRSILRYKVDGSIPNKRAVSDLLPSVRLSMLWIWCFSKI